MPEAKQRGPADSIDDFFISDPKTVYEDDLVGLWTLLEGNGGKPYFKRFISLLKSEGITNHA